MTAAAVPRPTVVPFRDRRRAGSGSAAGSPALLPVPVPTPVVVPSPPGPWSLAAVEAAVAAAATSNEVARGAPHAHLAVLWCLAGRTADAVRVLAEGRHRAASLQCPAVDDALRDAGVLVSFFAGRWDEVEAEVGSGDPCPWLSGEAAACIGMVALYRGDLADARTWSAEAWRRGVTTRHVPRGLFASWLDVLVCARPPACGASAHWLGALIDEVVADPSDDAGLLAAGAVVADYATVADATGQEIVAAAVVRRFLDAVEAAAPGSVALAAGLRARAVLTRSVDDAVAAVETLRSAGRPLDHILAAETAGLLAAEAGDRVTASMYLEEAAHAAAQLGAPELERRVDASLRRLGVRHGVRGRRRRPTVGWDALTPTERQVVELVVAGLSNPAISERLYISRRTVETHVSSALRKTGAPSRVQLAVAAAGCLPVGRSRT